MKKSTHKRLTAWLLTLVMLLSLLPTTALAADYPGPTYISVDGRKTFAEGKLYFKNGDSADIFTGTSTDFNAAYDPTTGTLTLDGYNGGAIALGGAVQGDLTIKLIGDNTIHSTTSRYGVAGSTASDSITITADSGSNGKLTIDVSNSTDYVYGIDGIQRSVTITGSADVTIIAEAKSTDKLCFGINSNTTVSILGNASVDIKSKVPENNTSSNLCRGISGNKVTIDTDGKVKIDVTEAGEANSYADSYGVDTTSSTILTKVGEMQVKWKKGTFPYLGGAISRGDSFSDTDHAINVDKDKCYASYRHGTPRTVTVENGTFTGPGVPNATKYSGKFLEGDTVSITPYEMKGSSGETIPFKEWTSSNVTLSSPTTEINSFTVPGEDVTVTAKHDPFDGAPSFTPTGTTNTTGTLTFKTKVKPGDGSEYFRLVKDGDQNDESKYIKLRNLNPSTLTIPYEYSYGTTSSSGTNQVEAGDYYVVEKLNGTYYLSEKFTVNYVKPRPEISVSYWPDPTVFTSVEVGYDFATGRTLTIDNKGTADTGPLTITVEGANPEAFTVSPSTISNIAAGKSAMSTVRPATGLPAGTYTATLKISGDNVNTLSINMKFTVKDPNASATVGGTITSYGNASEAVTVTLLQGTSVIGSPQVLTGASGSAPYSQTYSFPTVPAGTYTLKVEKKGHAPWTEEITVDSAAIAKDVTVYLWGDVNRDGEVTAADAQEIQRNAAGLSSVFDTDPNSAYCTLRADVNKDEKVTAADAQEIQRKAAGLSSTISTLP